MLHGLLNHDTDKEIDRNYVDTHGQSTVGFAFCHLLGFELLPRFKIFNLKSSIKHLRQIVMKTCLLSLRNELLIGT